MHSDDPESDAEVVAYARDEKIDDAETSILDFFRDNQGKVFYERQLTVMFERSYFHWITVKALLELASGGSINSQTLELVPEVPIRFFWAKGNRYWKRQAAKVINLVRRFSDTTVTHAIGFQGELLVDAALPLADFTPVARNARTFKDKTWVATGHDLDRIIRRDDTYYGVEIKNTLPYIPRDELRIKLAMCKYLGLTPLFISRMAPKNYNYEIIQQGGISRFSGVSSIRSVIGSSQLRSNVSCNCRLTARPASKMEPSCAS